MQVNMPKFMVAAAVAVLFFAAGCAPRERVEKSEFEITYARELAAARRLLQDQRSKDVFDASLRLFTSPDMWNISEDLLRRYHPGLAEFRQYFHPLVPINPGYIVVDAGAYGKYPMIYFSKAVGAEGKVLAFEPFPEAIEYNLELLRRYNIENVTIIPLALYSEPGYLRLFVHGPHGQVSIHASEAAPSLEVKAVRLDDFVIEHNINRIDFIKMDIESAEMAALLGAENVLRTHKPNLAISIYHKKKDLFRIILWLNSLDIGYKFWLDIHEQYCQAERILYAISTKRQKTN